MSAFVGLSLKRLFRFWAGLALFAVCGAALAEADEATQSDDLAEQPPRLEQERVAGDNPYLFTAHKPNYILPISYTSSINDTEYRALVPSLADELKQEEVEFQLSLKLRLSDGDLLFQRDGIYFGFTIASFWQLYSQGISAPFRETNYTPEIFYLSPLPKKLWEGDVGVMFGMEHQSNGQIQGFSRSWNRLYAAGFYSKERFVSGLKLWYRLPEKKKSSPLEPEGDDNPDIYRYFGYSELFLGWRGSAQEYTFRMHGNPTTGKGGGEVALSFPFFGRFRGVVKYFNGYGNSLIDYNHFQQRIGVGVLISNLL